MKGLSIQRAALDRIGCGLVAGGWVYRAVRAHCGRVGSERMPGKQGEREAGGGDHRVKQEEGMEAGERQ